MEYETSTSIALWAEQTFGPATALSTAIRAQKELTELIELLQQLAEGRQTVRLSRDLQTADMVANKVVEEVADVVIVLSRVQRFFGVPLGSVTMEEAVQAKMAVNRARRWRLDGNGHGQHIEESAP